MLPWDIDVSIKITINILAKYNNNASWYLQVHACLLSQGHKVTLERYNVTFTFLKTTLLWGQNSHEYMAKSAIHFFIYYLSPRQKMVPNWKPGECYIEV